MLRLLIAAFFGLLFFSCNRGRSKITWTKEPAGYYYRLLSFNTEKFIYEPGKLCKLSVSFLTQSDSLFWNSTKDQNDGYYITIDSLTRDNFLQRHASRSAVGDSVSLLIRPETFFSQMYNGEKPSFVEKDSVVKIHFKVREIFSESPSLSSNTNVTLNEMEQIRGLFSSEETFLKAKDRDGFYWLKKSENKRGDSIRMGQHIRIRFRGQLLNGRYIDSAARNFDLSYGTPDQVLTGINYVIGRLKIGENAKIILPSRLAFGEYGSGDGSVPPHTPLIYDISIIQ